MAEPSDVQLASERHKASLLRNERAAASDMVRVYGGIWRRTKPQLDALLQSIEEARQHGDLLEEICKRVLDIGNFGYENDVDVTWPETTPQDAKAEAETLAIHKTLGVSTDTILDKLGYDAATEQENKQGEMDAEDEVGDRLLSAFERGADSARRGATNGQEAATGPQGQMDAADGGRMGTA